MDDVTRRILKDTPDLLRKYEKREAKYILDLDDEYETIDLDLDISLQEYELFIKKLVELNMCFDEWCSFSLKNMILKELINEQLSD